MPVARPAWPCDVCCQGVTFDTGICLMLLWCGGSDEVLWYYPLPVV